MPSFDLSNFSNESVITNGLSAPLALGFLPDNRMLVLEKGGEIFISDPNTGNKSPYLNISNIVNSGNERGLLDIAIPPDFDPDPSSGKNKIYLFYTRSGNTNRAVIGSFDHVEGAGGLASTASAASEEILWTDTDAYVACCHYGGGLDFGPDGKLWLTSADKFNTSNDGEGNRNFPGGGDDNWTVNVENTSGKIIRINPDGSIPDGSDGWPANPYVDGVVDGPYPSANNPEFGNSFDPDPSIWAYGLRNPFRADWDEEYGYFYIGEVGGNQGPSTDDLHLASLDQPGAFYGWNFYEGVNNFEPNGSVDNFDPDDFPQPDTDLADPGAGDYFSAPIFDIPHSSLTGGFVYRGNMFPDEFDGVYFYGNFENNYIRFLDLDSTGTQVQGDYQFKPSQDITGSVSNIVFLDEGKDGALYYINYTATGGRVQRIVYDNGGGQAPNIGALGVTDNQGDPNDAFGANIPLDVTLSATVSDSDTPLGDLDYTINFGDGTVVTGAPNPNNGNISVSHQYTAEGAFDVVLTVDDGTNSTLAQPILVTVGDPNDAPDFLSVAADPPFIQAGETVTFTAVVNDVDASDPPQSLTYVVDFGDGSPTVTGSPDANGQIVVTHTYSTDSANGPFNAFFTISDSQAASTRSANIPIQVGTPTQVPVTDGLVFNVDATIKIGLNGSTVTEWLDQSGNGNNLAASGNPQLVENATPSGLPAIVLDGVGDALGRTDGAGTPITGLPAGNGPRTMFFVVDYDDVTNNEYAGLVYGNAQNNQAFGLTLDGNQDDLTIQGWGGQHDRRTDVDGVIDPVTGQQRGFISHAVVFDGNSFTQYLNGVEVPTANNTKTYNTVIDQLLIGGNLNGGETPMSVAAALIYDRALNTNEFNAVENYLQTTFLTEGGGGGGNGQPTAIDDSFATTLGQTLSVPSATGLLNNDVDDGPLTVTSVNGQAVGNSPFSLANGVLTIAADGSFDYTPDATFTGNETFTYTVSDGELSDSANVTISVSDPSTFDPTSDTSLVAYFESDINVIVENNVVTEWLSGAGTILDLVATGDPRFVPGATPSGQAAISLDGGLAAFGETGAAEGDKLSRTTAGGQAVGPLPTGNAPRTMYFVVDYKAMNGVSAGVAYGTGTQNDAFGLVLNRNGVPTVQGWGRNNDYPAGGQNGIGNNDGSAGDDWFIHSVRYDGTTIRHYRDDQLIDSDNHTFTTAIEEFVIGEEISGLGYAALDVAAVFAYDRELNDAEHNETIQYLTDKYLTSSPSSNNPPVADNDSASTTEDASVSIDVLNGDTDSDGTITGVTLIDGITVGVGQAVTLGSGATATLQANGQIVYNPNGQFESLNDGESLTDNFVYTIADNDGATANATVTVTVNGVTDGGGGGGGPSNNPVTAGLIAAFESDSGIGTNGNLVTGWNDSSGSANTYNLSGVEGNPELVVGGTPTGENAIAFDGNGDQLRIFGNNVDLFGLPSGDNPRTLFFVVDYKRRGEWTGFGYGDNEASQSFALTTNRDELLAIDGWTNSANRVSTEEGVLTKSWMVQSVVLDGTTYKHYIHTASGGLQLIDTGTDGSFNTDTGIEAALTIGGKVSGTVAGEMDVAAGLIYNNALSTGTNDLGGNHAAVSQYLFDKYLG